MVSLQLWSTRQSLNSGSPRATTTTYHYHQYYLLPLLLPLHLLDTAGGRKNHSFYQTVFPCLSSLSIFFFSFFSFFINSSFLPQFIYFFFPSYSFLSPSLPSLFLSRLIRFFILVTYGRSVLNFPSSSLPGRPVAILSSIALSLEQTQSAFSARWWKPEETVSHCLFVADPVRNFDLRWFNFVRLYLSCA